MFPVIYELFIQAERAFLIKRGENFMYMRDNSTLTYRRKKRWKNKNN